MNLLDLARSAVPVETPKAPPSAAVRLELARLIGVILPDESDAERAEALSVALADPDAALQSFRLLAAEKQRDAADDRRTCRQCGNYGANGDCKAAARGEKLGSGHGRVFHPAPDVLLRCEGFEPRDSDRDRRRGAERWPGISRTRCAAKTSTSDLN
jgi:hypothetical protein